MTPTIVVLDGLHYRVQPRAGKPPLIYKRYPTGVYFRWMLVFGNDARRSKTPKLGSTMARVLAAATAI